MTADEQSVQSEAVGSQSAAQSGMSWSWKLDFETLLTALATPAGWHRSPAAEPTRGDPADHPQGDPVDAAQGDPADAAQGDPADAAGVDPAEAELAEYLDAVEAGRSRVIPLDVVAGQVAESLPTGPDLAGWLATSSVQGLENGALAGMAASYRRLASWAQAGELAVVAELASRSAAADEKIGVDKHGRPLRLTVEACAQISLALTMSQASATWWSDLGVTLAWRLAATGAALRAGEIDLGRARLIAEATAVLDEETARAVEARVLPRAGEQTTGQLRAALRRAVIAADPEGAERRREEAERRAKVSLYPDAEGTASLAGYSLPGIRAAAAMARITALARAMKASGAGGGMDLLRAQVFLGLLLGTLPYIPPAPDGPPDEPPSGEPSSGESPSSEPPESDPPESDPPESDPLRGDRAHGDQPGKRRDEPRDGPPRPGRRSSSGPQGAEPEVDEESGPDDPREPPGYEPPGYEPTGPPGVTDADDDDLWPGSRPPPTWPQVPALLPAAPAAMGNLPPVGGGLLDLRVPWATLTGESGEPGHLSRLGPLTPAQARHLADLAAADRGVTWRVIVTTTRGRALAVTRVSPHLAGAGSARAGPDGAGSTSPAGNGAGSPVVGRITVTISKDDLACPPAKNVPVIFTRVLGAARRASEREDRRAAADRAAAGPCAHSEASLTYRPPARLWEYVMARDLTCRFPTCRQPARRCDLDHTTPYDKGGRTCSCNLGGLCRFHHQLKQHVRWQLVQAVPGTFTWTTPAGRTYVAEPDTH